MNEDASRKRELEVYRQAQRDETTRKKKVCGGAQRVLELENGQQGDSLVRMRQAQEKRSRKLKRLKETITELQETTRKRELWGGARKLLELENGQHGNPLFFVLLFLIFIVQA